MVHLQVQGGKAAEMPEVSVFRHLVKISRPAQPVQYADVEGRLTFPELECLQHLPVSGEVGGHVALHGGLASPQDVRPEEFRLGGMKRHRSSGVNILPHSRAFSTSLALSVLK